MSLRSCYHVDLDFNESRLLLVYIGMCIHNNIISPIHILVIYISYEMQMKPIWVRRVGFEPVLHRDRGMHAFPECL